MGLSESFLTGAALEDLFVRTDSEPGALCCGERDEALPCSFSKGEGCSVKALRSSLMLVWYRGVIEVCDVGLWVATSSVPSADACASAVGCMSSLASPCISSKSNYYYYIRRSKASLKNSAVIFAGIGGAVWDGMLLIRGQDVRVAPASADTIKQ
jgi:hypothetical protein